MSFSRRDIMKLGGAGVAGLALSKAAYAADPSWNGEAAEPAQPIKDYTPVITPGGATLDYKIKGKAKIFHLIAQEVEHEFAPGLTAKCWGYNGRTHGPTIEAVEGDLVRVYVTNKLKVPTTVHWHGVILPSGMDGVGGLNQPVIQPGQTFRYEWVFRQHGTFMYHSHHDEMTQMAMGMMGMIVVHPRKPKGRLPDRDFAFMLSEWDIKPGTSRPNPLAMDGFNILTLNAKSFPGTPPLVAKKGDKVRLRFGNLSAMDHHPIHLHGYNFHLTETDGGQIPQSARWPETTVLVPTGSTRTVEFNADNPGDWAMHCHMTHHVMNQMGHDLHNTVGAAIAPTRAALAKHAPGAMVMNEVMMSEHGKHVQMGHMKIPKNSIPMVGGMGPHDYITMGGMFTILKVRENLTSYDDPGWYTSPADEQARQASQGELAADGIKI